MLSENETKPAILSLIPGYSNHYVPNISSPQYPKPLSSLYDPSFLKLNYPELLKQCEAVELIVTPEMAQSVEGESKQQCHSSIWYRHRPGQNTASKMKAVCHTNSASPSQSLIKQICNPKSFVFQSKQTKWDCSHEELARKRYEDSMTKSHENFHVADSGFIINPLWPFAGATPDGIISCSCCGAGVLQIKCPYSYRERDNEIAAEARSFVL